jgi:HK97 gp10 family phage protein
MTTPLVSVRIEGLEALIAKCKAPVHAAPIRAAFRESALDLEAKAKSLTPRKTGNLQRSIMHRIDGAAIPTFGEVGLLGGGPVGKAGQRYGVYVHEGTRPHVIMPRSKKALFWRGASHPVRKVRHPGTRANPFLTNALNQLRGKIQGYFDRAARQIEGSWGGR